MIYIKNTASSTVYNNGAPIQVELGRSIVEIYVDQHSKS